MARNCLSLAKKVLDQMPRLEDIAIIVAAGLPIGLGGMTAVLPAAASSWITRSSASNALSAIRVCWPTFTAVLRTGTLRERVARLAGPEYEKELQ